MQDFNGIQIFTAVVEQQGIRAAAEKLAIPKSTVSRGVAALEERLGVRLIERTTRAIRVTEAGRQYYVHCRRMVDELEHADALIQNRKGSLEGTLRISAVAILGKCLMSGVINEFISRHANVRIIVDLNDRLVDLIQDGYDLAIRLGPPGKSSGIVSRRLAMPSAGLYASRVYLEAYGYPQCPEDLASHRTLALGPPDRPASWTLRQGERTEAITINPVVLSNDITLLTRCAADGAGICLIPDFCVPMEDPMARLVPVLPQWCHTGMEVRVLYVSHKSVSPLMRALLDLLVEQAPALLEPTVGRD